MRIGEQMIDFRCSPEEILEAISTYSPASVLIKKIRSGSWDASDLNEVANALEVVLLDKRPNESVDVSMPTRDLLALIAVMYFSKDKFEFHRGSSEYQAMERLFGRIIAALGL